MRAVLIYAIAAICFCAGAAVAYCAYLPLHSLVAQLQGTGNVTVGSPNNTEIHGIVRSIAPSGAVTIQTRDPFTEFEETLTLQPTRTADESGISAGDSVIVVAVRKPGPLTMFKIVEAYEKYD